MTLDAHIIELAARYRPLAERLLKEAIRIPADWVDRESEGDPEAGLSGHEGARLRYLKSMLVEHHCVARPEDTGFDDFGNLWWTVEREDDPTPAAAKAVVYFDGHSDTVQALREQWREKIGEGMDCYLGLTDPDRIDATFIERQLGWVPSREQWGELIFGRGSADQLGGVVCQMIATKIMLELANEGALDGVAVWSYATVSEEDNDGGGPMYLCREVLPGAGPERIPDVVVLTEGTGHAERGALGIYRGQRGRMQIEVEVVGRSCHGSMPWEGLNPLEYGAEIIAEARVAYDARQGFADHPFLGHGTRTASWARLDTPSDCAVPDRFVFRFDRRLTVGEDPEQARADVEQLAAVGRARQAGLQVQVRVPRYDKPSWRGHRLGNQAIYPGWLTPDADPAVQAATDSYRRVVGPPVAAAHRAADVKVEQGGMRRSEPRVERWIFSTDGVGFQLPAEPCPLALPTSKGWIRSGPFVHPPMIGCGPGIEHNTHKIGECVDARELESSAALLARFPSLYATTKRAG